MRVLVTGGAGFMGGHLLRALEAVNIPFWGVDDLSGGTMDALPPKTPIFNRDEGGKPNRPEELHGAIFTQADLRSPEQAARVVEMAQPTILCHLAANAREGASQFQPQDVTQRNLAAYVNVLTPAIAAGVRKVVLYSSMAVYGDGLSPFSELAPLKPCDVYGCNKRAMEEITRILARVHGFEYTILRPHNVYGPGQSLSDPYRNVIGIWMNQIMRDEPIRIFGDGHQRRAFSYIDNMIGPMVRACGLGGPAQGATINLGDADPVRLRRLSEIVRVAMGAADHPLEYVPARPLEVREAWCTIERSIKRLGYGSPPVIDLEQGIQAMAEWALTQGPQEWKRETMELPSGGMPAAWA